MREPQPDTQNCRTRCAEDRDGERDCHALAVQLLLTEQIRAKQIPAPEAYEKARHLHGGPEIEERIVLDVAFEPATAYASQRCGAGERKQEAERREPRARAA